MSRIRQIITEYLKNNYPDDVKKSFARWLKHKRSSKEKEEILMDVWDNIPVETGLSADAAFAQIENRLFNAPATRKAEKKSIYTKLYRIAAVIMLPIVSVGITYYIMKDSAKIESRVQLVECIVPNGEMRTITLPDSSVVIVNSGSMLIYPEKFTHSRDIFLNGEAYFTVTKDESKPFIVKTTDMDIEVLGTVFNVNAYTNSDKTSTTLESGKVSVTLKNASHEQLALSPDECATYNRRTGLLEKSTVKVENIKAWTDGNMVIQSMTINEVMKFVERKYDMEVSVRSHNYDHQRITMKVKNNENIDDFMNALKILVPQLKYKIENDKLYIY